MAAALSDDDLATLREHGIVIFGGRVIFDARAPMPEERIRAIEALCAGPLPEGLRALWRQAAGGRLDYDLDLRMNGHAEPVSFSEIFVDGPHDAAMDEHERSLAEWIAHEQLAARDAAEAAGQPWDGRLAMLPIGGFEDSDRLYVVVDPDAPEHGCVVAWKRGLPRAWPHAMHEDGTAGVAADVEGAFAALHLNEDPLATDEEGGCGQALLDYLDERHARGLDGDLIDRVLEVYRAALLDWRAALSDGTLSRDPRLVHVAVRHAVAHDDAKLVQELAAAGVAFDAPLLGSATATDLALSHGAFAAAQALVDVYAPVSPDALDDLDGAVSPELTARLMARGAEPSAAAMAQCVACGAPASARLIGQALADRGEDVPARFEAARADLLEQLDDAMAQVRAGHLEHHLGVDGLMRRADYLRSFEL